MLDFEITIYKLKLYIFILKNKKKMGKYGDLVEWGKDLDIVYFDASKTLDTVSLKFLIDC